jgi:hypothetical protein
MSVEYVTRFGVLDDGQLIDNLFEQLFNRTADPLGRAFYIDLLGGTNHSGLNPSGRQTTLAQLALDIANGAQNDDRTILKNKLNVADYFTKRVVDTGGSYTSNEIGEAVTIIASVDQTDSSVNSALELVDDFLGSGADEGVFGSLRITGSSQVPSPFTPDTNPASGLGASAGFLQSVWLDFGTSWALTANITESGVWSRDHAERHAQLLDFLGCRSFPTRAAFLITAHGASKPIVGRGALPD